MNLQGIGYNVSKFKAIILSRDGNTFKCRHLTTTMKFVAECNDEEIIDKLEINQVVEIKYSSKRKKATYEISSDLIGESTAKIIEVQHIISNKQFYISMILVNKSTNDRLHIIVDNNSRVFKESKILVRGDIVKVITNNGRLFRIELV